MSQTEEFFRQQLPELIKAKRSVFGKLKHSVQFSVEGKGGGEWAIDVEGTPHVVVGRLPKTGSQLRCSASTFDALVGRQLTLRQAFDLSVVRLGGDASTAMRLGLIFQPVAGEAS